MRQMRFKRWTGLALLAAALLLAACEPGVTVQNSTTFTVRVAIFSRGTRQLVSPAAGGSSFAVVHEGTYSAVAFPDTEWIAYAKLVRADLNEQLKNSDNLSGDQLIELVQRLSDIAEQMKGYEEAAAGGAGASCGGRVSEEGAGLVTVTQGADGRLVVSCQ